MPVEGVANAIAVPAVVVDQSVDASESHPTRKGAQSGRIQVEAVGVVRSAATGKHAQSVQEAPQETVAGREMLGFALAEMATIFER